MDINELKKQMIPYSVTFTICNMATFSSNYLFVLNTKY